MKKLYSFFTILFLALASFNVYAQEMLQGVNMEAEDAEFWTIMEMSIATEDDIVTNEFGYTDDGPFAGDGGCFHSYGSTEGDINLFIFQEVYLQAGVEYICNLAFKNTIDFNGSWNEIFIGEVAPEAGVDYTPDTPATVLGGWKWSDWEAGCTDIVDGTLADDNCISGSDTIMLEGSGEILAYIGFKFGMGWATGPYDYDLMIDNFSLMGPEVAVESATINPQNRVYPNPATDQIRISNVDANEIQIFDIVGKKVYATFDVSQEMTIDISGFKDGMYFVRTGKSTTMILKQ